MSAFSRYPQSADEDPTDIAFAVDENGAPLENHAMLTTLGVFLKKGKNKIWQVQIGVKTIGMLDEHPTELMFRERHSRKRKQGRWSQNVRLLVLKMLLDHGYIPRITKESIDAMEAKDVQASMSPTSKGLDATGSGEDSKTTEIA